MYVPQNHQKLLLQYLQGFKICMIIPFPSSQRRSANIQNLIQSIRIESPSADQESPKSKSGLKRVKSAASTIDGEVEVSKLSTEDFMEWLKRKGYSVQDCQAFRSRCKS